MDKATLRKNTIKKLKEMDQLKRNEIETNLHKTLIESTYWKNANMIGVTISQGFEWDTKHIIESAWNDGKHVCAPKCDPKRKQLHFYKIHSFEDLEVVYYNLLEPKQEETTFITKSKIDLLIVPGMLFDKQGYRIGFGGGFYDRYLTDYKNETVSLTSKIQLLEEIPKESFDIPVNHIITESGFVK